VKTVKNIPPKIFVGLDMKEDINFDIITKLVCDEFGAKREEVLSISRKREFIEPKQVIQYFCRKFLKTNCLQKNGKIRKMPLREVARLTKTTNHATILSNIKAVNNLIDTDKGFKKRIEAIKALINEYNLIANKNKKDA